MTGLVRGLGIGFPQIEFMVRSQSRACAPLYVNFHKFSVVPPGLGSIFSSQPRTYVRGYNLSRLRCWFGSASRLERAQARAGGAAVVAGLGRFAGEMRGNREQGRSCSFAKGQGLRQRWERRKIFDCLGVLSVADHEGNVDVFEYLARSDAENSVSRFDEIVALAAGVLTAERVGEVETGVELLGFDKETCAVCDPAIRSFHGAPTGSEIVIKNEKR
jgi:hypothetical protein